MNKRQLANRWGKIIGFIPPFAKIALNPYLCALKSEVFW